jgi:hypothetical protein
MFKKTHCAGSLITSCLLLSSMTTGSLMLGGDAVAGNGHIKSMSLNLAVSNGSIHVVSEDGKKWSAIKPTDLGISGPISAKMKTGYISSYHLRLGVCGDDAQCNQAYPVIYGPKNLGASDMSFSKDISFAMNTVIAPVSDADGIAPNPSFDSIIGKCNALLSQGKSIHKEHTLFSDFSVTFAVETDGAIISDFDSSGGGDPPVDFRAADNVPVKVVCEAADALDIAVPPVPFKVSAAELYLATFKGDGPVPTQGTACKVLRVTARFKTTTTGLVHFDLSHKVGDQGIETTPITIEAKKKPDGSYAAEYVNTWFLDKPTNAQFYVQETDGLGVSAGWKEINVTCDNNFADPTSQPTSDEPQLKVLKSKFTVTTFQNDSVTGCPVNAALDVEFITNKPGGVPFKVTGTDGFVWNFSIKAEEALGPLQIGEGQAQFAKSYRAKYRRMLQVSKTTDALYSLEVRNVAAEPSAKKAGPDNLKVRCGGDLAVPFAVTGTELNIVGLPGCPTTAFAAATFVTNGPGNVRYRLAATTGDVETGTVTAKKVGNRFVAAYQMPVKITKGGEVIFSAIPLDFPKMLALKKKQYNCGGPKPGDVSGGTRPKPQLDPKTVVIDPPRVIDPPKKKVVPVIVTPKPLICAGGVVRSGNCVCPAGFKTVKAAPNAFRCVLKAPTVLSLPKAGKVLSLPKAKQRASSQKLPVLRLQ